MSHIINYSAKNFFKLKFTAIAKQYYQCFNQLHLFLIYNNQKNITQTEHCHYKGPPFFILNLSIWINIWKKTKL